jgi:hypothetical protein
MPATTVETWHPLVPRADRTATRWNMVLLFGQAVRDSVTIFMHISVPLRPRISLVSSSYAPPLIVLLADSFATLIG